MAGGIKYHIFTRTPVLLKQLGINAILYDRVSYNKDNNSSARC